MTEINNQRHVAVLINSSLEHEPSRRGGGGGRRDVAQLDDLIPQGIAPPIPFGQPVEVA